MTPSLRLVVAWMVGVVAALGAVSLAAWRGQLWFHDALAGCAAALPSPVAPVDASSDTIRKYLRAHFDEIESRYDGRLTGLAYDGAPLVELRNDRIQRALPGTSFFTTRVRTAEFEYQEVETLVSFSRGSEHDDIRSLLSPVFGRQSHKFFRQFLGLAAATAREREELALGLAELLAAITYAGAARPSLGQGDWSRAELWHGELHWRNIEITSDHIGRVNRIVVRNPRNPPEVDDASDFVFVER